jgi:hypothetical protein
MDAHAAGDAVARDRERAGDGKRRLERANRAVLQNHAQYPTRVQSTAWNSAILIFALVVPWPILGAISWYFWKHRHDE